VYGIGSIPPTAFSRLAESCNKSYERAILANQRLLMVRAVLMQCISAGSVSWRKWGMSVAIYNTDQLAGCEAGCSEAASNHSTPTWLRSAWQAIEFLLLPLALVAAAVAALSMDLDCPLAQWCGGDRCPRFFRDLFHYAEPFGHGSGVLIVAAIVFILDVEHRWALPRVLGCALFSGLMADGVKMLIARARPYDFDFNGNVWTTFGAWFPLTSAGSGGQSFPSAHTATAVGFALGLTWLYPRGRYLFPLIAALVACQRIESGAHFLSDVLCGAAVGYLVATALLRIGPLPRCFAFWEQRWKLPAGASRDTTSAAR
jgi:membrane-associated phospholipid phosphatase